MSIQEHELQNLIKSRDSLAKRLENDPVFQALQHIDKAIAVLEQQALPHSKPSVATSNVIYGVVSAAQRDVIANAAIQQLLQTRNVPVTVKELCEALQTRGTPLPEYAISSVGAILGKRDMFVKCPDKAGNWKLTSEYLLQHSGPRAA